jgi:hypothetical protein
MTTSLSTYLEQATLACWLGGVAITPPGTIYVALYSVVPSAGNASGTELTGNGYARIGVANNQVAGWNAPSGSVPASVANKSTITFGIASSNWPPIVGFALYDAVTAGNELAWASISPSVTITSGNQAVFAPGALIVQLN